MGVFGARRPLGRFTYATPQVAVQARRFIAARLLLYLGTMSSYFIGVMGTLTFSLGAGVGDNAIAVGMLNLCIVFGQMRGGALLDRIGPRSYFRVAALGMIASGLLYQFVGTSIAGVFLGAAVFGLAWGVADTVPRAFPAYLTDDVSELKRINALVTLTGNISIVIGPIVGGAIALVAPTRMVFLFMAACSAAALIPGWGIRALRDPKAEKGAPAKFSGGSRPAEGAVGAGAAGGPGNGKSMRISIPAGFSSIFESRVLTLLFWATLLSFMGYGAFDPLESLFYRDVLHVGADWMGWLSALAGMGGMLGAAFVGMVPHRFINVRSLLIVLFLSGLGSLLYVATPFVAAACAGQFALGVAFSAFGPIKDTLVQLHTPLDRIGRVNAAMGAGYNMAGTIPLLCAPVLARVLGVQGTLVAVGAIVTAAPLAILLVRRREIDDLASAERA